MKKFLFYSLALFISYTYTMENQQKTKADFSDTYEKSIRQSIASGDSQIINRIDQDGYTPLEKAAANKNVQFIDFLVQNGADVDLAFTQSKKKEGFDEYKDRIFLNDTIISLMKKAIQDGNKDTVEKLLGDEIKLKDVLHDAFECRNDEITKILLKKIKTCNNKVVPLSIRDTEQEYIQFLVACGANIKPTIQHHFKLNHYKYVKQLIDIVYPGQVDLQQLFQEALLNNNFDQVRFCLDAGLDLSLPLLNTEDLSLLNLIDTHENTDIARILLAKYNSLEKKDYTLLGRAAIHKDKERVKKLIKYGENIHAAIERETKQKRFKSQHFLVEIQSSLYQHSFQKSLTDAILNNDFKRVKGCLYKHKNTDLSTPISEIDGLTVLDLAFQNQNKDIIKLLISAQNEIDGSQTFLRQAAEQKDQARTQTLITCGADINGAITQEEQHERKKNVEFLKTFTANLLEQVHSKKTNTPPAQKHDETIVQEEHKKENENTQEYDTDLLQQLLIYAVKQNNSKLVEMLLEEGAIPVTRTRNESNPLVIANQLGYINIENILACADVKDNPNRIINYQTLMSVAAGAGNYELVKKLLCELHADPNHTLTYETHPLVIARKHNHADIVELLTQHGACEPIADFPNAFTQDLHRNMEENQKKTKYSISKVGFILLGDTAKKQDTRLARYLVQHGANIDKAIIQERGHGRESNAQFLERIKEPNKNIPTHDKRALQQQLINAVKQNNSELVEMLLEEGADPFCVSENGFNALELAIKYDYKKLANILICANLKNNPNVILKNQKITLALACESGNYALAKKLLCEVKADPNVALTPENHPLVLARNNGHTNIVNLLVQHSAHKADQQSALIQSTQHVMHDAAKLLKPTNQNQNDTPSILDDLTTNVKKQLATSCANYELQTQLGQAIMNNYELYIETLLANPQVNPFNTGAFEQPSLTLAQKKPAIAALLKTCQARMIDEKTAEMLPSENNTHMVNTSSLTQAIENGMYHTTQMLLRSKANPNLTDSEETSHLTVALHSHNHSLAALLLNYNAHTDEPVYIHPYALLAIQPEKKHTVKTSDIDNFVNRLFENKDPELQAQFEKAIQEGNFKDVQALLQQEVNPRYVSEGCTSSPLQLAQASGHEQIEQIIRKSMEEQYIYALGRLIKHNPYYLNLINEKGDTLLIDAVRENEYDRAKFLLEEGAKPYISPTYETNPLVLAETHGHEQIASLLEKYGAHKPIADYPTEGTHYLHTLSQQGALTLESLYEPNADGLIPLNLAVKKRDKHLTTFLSQDAESIEHAYEIMKVHQNYDDIQFLNTYKAIRK